MILYTVFSTTVCNVLKAEGIFSLALSFIAAFRNIIDEL